jgi:isopenicillin N synthase-like dioxygenase
MKTEALSRGTIPTIDISRFLTGRDAEKRAVAVEIAEACETAGFLILSGHGIPQSILDSAFQHSREFFDLEQTEKDRWHTTGPSRQRGYHALATRGLANTLDKSVPLDLRETVFLGPVDDHRARFTEQPDALVAHAPNIYPETPSLFSPALVKIYQSFERLANDILRIFAVTLEMPEAYFVDKMDHHFSILSSHHYPALSEPPLPGQLRTGAHTDFGAFTILSMTNAIGGLEALLPDGRWMPIKPRPGTLVVNLGDMMARWTNDRWTSTLHRVVNPPKIGAWGSRRQSIGFFAHPNFDAEIACIPTCLKPGAAPIYPPITAGEHIALKIAKSHQGTA